MHASYDEHGRPRVLTWHHEPPLPCPPCLFRPLFTTVCFCLPNLEPFTRPVTLFSPLSPTASRRISPRGPLCRPVPSEDRPGERRTIKESGSFDERTETLMEVTAMTTATSRFCGRTKVYIREFTLRSRPPQKKQDGCGRRRKIFCHVATASRLSAVRSVGVILEENASCIEYTHIHTRTNARRLFLDRGHVSGVPNVSLPPPAS